MHRSSTADVCTLEADILDILIGQIFLLQLVNHFFKFLDN